MAARAELKKMEGSGCDNNGPVAREAATRWRVRLAQQHGHAFARSFKVQRYVSKGVKIFTEIRYPLFIQRCCLVEAIQPSVGYFLCVQAYVRPAWNIADVMPVMLQPQQHRLYEEGDNLNSVKIFTRFWNVSLHFKSIAKHSMLLSSRTRSSCSASVPQAPLFRNPLTFPLF